MNKDILAQGELMSTKLFSVYLEEQGIDHALLPALEFMSIDENDEPQVAAIRKKADASLAATSRNITSLLPRVISAEMHGAKWIT